MQCDNVFEAQVKNPDITHFSMQFKITVITKQQ